MKPDTVKMRDGIIRINISVEDHVLQSNGLREILDYPCGHRSKAKMKYFRLTLYTDPHSVSELKHYLMNRRSVLARRFLACMKANGIGG